MSKDILAVSLEAIGKNGEGHEKLYICVCYMTVGGTNVREENKLKCELIKKVVNEYGRKLG